MLLVRQNKVLSLLPPAIGFDVEFVLVDKGEGEVVPVPHVSEDRQVHF
jgi:hypothetical protein